MSRRNLLNAEQVSQSFGHQTLLNSVSLGVAVGERIGVVGRNGEGKSTLLKLLTGHQTPDSGRVTVGSGLQVGYLAQSDELDLQQSIREFVLGARADHEWASEARTREVLTELLGGFDPTTLDRPIHALSGGERRRVALARLLMHDVDLLVLDEPTNHLDVEAVAWLGEHLCSRAAMALLVVTHDRWFLDTVTERIWEVVGGGVEEYEGGYSAFVLAKAERERQASAERQRRNQLIRKELAWLRRGPPARTSKPRFRVDAANALIADEPPARNGVELLAFAGARLGKSVFELCDVCLSFGDSVILNQVTWNIGPGDRIGIVGINGTGKTSLARVILGQLAASSGTVVTGSTVKPAYLSQHLDELSPTQRVLEAVEDVARSVELGGGRTLTASQLCERLGFGPDRQWTPVGELSGGERRRLQLTRLLMAGPNVLVLDEPTNDFDVETLTALEDLLDSFAGTLLVISHDRYFLERVCDSFVGLLGDGSVRDLPGGVDEFLSRQRGSRVASTAPPTPPAPRSTAADERLRRKTLTRLERQLSKLSDEEKRILADMDKHATDHEAVLVLQERLVSVRAAKSTLEDEWLTTAESLMD